MTRRKRGSLRPGRVIAATALAAVLIAAARSTWVPIAIWAAAAVLIAAIRLAPLEMRVHTFRRELARPLPATALLAPRSFPQDTKVQAAVRDGGMCQCPGCPGCNWHRNLSPVCGNVNEIQFDHVVPWSLGGPSTLANCRTLCGPCNRAKGAKIR